MKQMDEIMTPLEKIPSIPYWFTIRQALAEMEDIQTSEEHGKYMPWVLLVFDAQNHLLGIVQRQNIIQGMRQGIGNRVRGIYPVERKGPADPDLSRLGFSQDRALGELRGQLERPVIDFMTPIQVTAEGADPILLGIHLMIDFGLSFVAVKRGGQIAGIAYIEDALHEVMTDVV